jgi:hypothetical protein
VSSRTACYRRVRDVRVRPLPELSACFVYTPAQPRLHTLNIAAWFILELCEGRSPRALSDAYLDEMTDAHRHSVGQNFFAAPPPPSPVALRRELRATLRELTARGIIELRNHLRG